MLAAIAASKDKSNQVVLYEKNEKLGKKLFITGKGRCNVTNAADPIIFYKNIVHNSKFMYSSFNLFSNIDFMKLLSENGLKIKIERGDRVFPESDKSFFVTDTLRDIMKKQKVKINLSSTLIDFKKTDIFTLKLKNNDTNEYFSDTCDKLIIATGGASYKSTGSTGDGYKFAKDNGINVIDIKPSLVPFNLKEVEDCKVMQGLSLKNVAIKILDADNKVLYNDFGEMLFTHFGVSGPIILSASSYIDVLDYDNKVLSIDLKPALSFEKLDLRLLREFEENNLKELKNILPSLLPSSMIEVFLARLSEMIGSDASNVKASDISKELRKNIISLLKDFRFTIVSKRSFDEAIITSGGIDVKEINPKTMESKKVKGLYFAGEVLDIDALTGGFNIQIAASTGFAAGNSQI